jgi:uncharacterized membrane protein
MIGRGLAAGKGWKVPVSIRNRMATWVAWVGPGGLNNMLGVGGQSTRPATIPIGSVVVGFDDSAARREAFRWTAAGGWVGLGCLLCRTVDSQVHAVSGDGAFVVGSTTTEAGVAMPAASGVRVDAGRRPGFRRAPSALWWETGVSARGWRDKGGIVTNSGRTASARPEMCRPCRTGWREGIWGFDGPGCLVIRKGRGS